MNELVSNWLSTCKPKLNNISDKDKRLYKAGIGLLGILLSKDFFDLPRIAEDKFSKEGLFYSIPFYDDEVLYNSGDQVMLLTVHKVANKSLSCPFRIDLKLKDTDNYSIIAYSQSGEKPYKLNLFECENGQCYTHIREYKTLKLSELMDIMSQ